MFRGVQGGKLRRTRLSGMVTSFNMREKLATCSGPVILLKSNCSVNLTVRRSSARGGVGIARNGCATLERNPRTLRTSHGEAQRHRIRLLFSLADSARSALLPQRVLLREAKDRAAAPDR